MGPQTSPSFLIMTTNKTGAFLTMGRIPQFFGQAALAVGLLAGSASLLNAGGAMAVNPDPFSPIDIPVFPNPGETVNGAKIIGITGPACTTGTPCSGDVEFSYNGVAANGRHTWAIDADFAPNQAGPYSGVFEYSLTAPNAGSGGRWLSAALTQNIVPGFNGATVTKEIYGDSGFTNLLLTLGPLSDAGSAPSTGFTNFTNADIDGTIYVRDIYSGTTGAQLDNIINSVQTPGPLPVLGAGAAFGFSRKLRGRIKAARLN